MPQYTPTQHNNKIFKNFLKKKEENNKEKGWDLHMESKIFLILPKR
jgi:hypothetical protein